MNLLTDPWLPFRHRDGDGRIEYRPPSALADPNVLDLALPRADFQGAAWQFLIALLQTAMTPKNTDAWLDRYQTPPSVAELDDLLAPFASAFELDGDGPRFMQDLDPLDNKKDLPIGGLLIDSPGESTTKKNRDFFVKRSRVESVCLDCAAIALYTMQINAPEGGAGNFTGLRGGGPLTTLVLPEDENAVLWERLWLNVMPTDVVGQPGQTWSYPSAYDSDLFFWVKHLAGHDKKSAEVYPDQVHPLHVFWPMPRRYRLIFSEISGVCDLCGRASSRLIYRLRSKTYGANYVGPWLHPLTNYRRLNPKKFDELPLSSKGQPGGLGYRHWPGLVLKDEAVSGTLPARIVTHHLQKYRMVQAALDDGEAFDALFRRTRLWVFGYDMKQMDARGWYNVEMPLIGVPEVYQDTLRDWIERFVELAENFAAQIYEQLEKAWFRDPKKMRSTHKKAMNALKSQVDFQFFEATQLAFFTALREMAEVLGEDGEAPTLSPEIYRQWYLELKREALTLFDAQATSGPLEGMKMQQLERITDARRYLLAYLSGSGEKIGKTVQMFAAEGSFELTTPVTEGNSEESPA